MANEIDLDVEVIVFNKNTSDWKQNIKKALEALNRTEQKTWATCSCTDKLKEICDEEINSTVYILYTLLSSIIWWNGKTPEPNDSMGSDKVFGALTRGTFLDTPLPFTIGFSKKLTGYWEKDQENCYITPKKTMGNARLIAGLGPSASGKTFMATEVIKILSAYDPTFPTLLLSIDGSIYRKTSITYQTIVKTVREKGYLGLANLHGKIFDSENVKKMIMNLLLAKKETIKFSLYVPHTLAALCVRCTEILKTYIDYTGDVNFIAVNIFQHKNETACPYSGKQKCVGCEAQGLARSSEEGKKYSSDAYSLSLRNAQGIIHSRKPGMNFEIHNSGKIENGQSIFFDFTSYTAPTMASKMKQIVEQGGLEYQVGKRSSNAAAAIGNTTLFVGKQAFRPAASVGKAAGKVVAFGAKKAVEKGKETYNQWVEDAQKLRGQKPGESFQRKAGPAVYAAPTGCVDVRVFGGGRTLRRRRFFAKKKNTRRCRRPTTSTFTPTLYPNFWPSLTLPRFT